jgi:putative membrane protein
MTTTRNFKSVLLVAFLGVCTLIGTSAFTSLRKNNIARTSKVETDAQFLFHAAEINLEEIQFGQLAQQKSMMTEVKELGKMMEQGHMKLQSELSVLADKKSIALPKAAPTKAMEEYKKLNNKSEIKFNEEYCELMIKGHKEAITLFEKAAKDSIDPEIKEWATATLPALRAHLDHAKSCKEKCEKM